MNDDLLQPLKINDIIYVANNTYTCIFQYIKNPNLSDNILCLYSKSNKGYIKGKIYNAQSFEPSPNLDEWTAWTTKRFATNKDLTKIL